MAEIVVTAQKREERLQGVPIAITALDATTLEASHTACFGVGFIKDVQHSVTPARF